MKTSRHHAWQLSASVFHARAGEYDRWYDDNPIFAIEVAALRTIETRLAAPHLEIGVGTGRFAEALHISLGLDPAVAPLRLAAGRGVAVSAGIGEALPIRTDSLGTIYLLFTLCFLADPGLTLRECGRSLQPKGHLVLGMVPAGSAWGQLLAEKKRDNHPFYRHARLYEVNEITELLARSGFRVVESISTLRQPPTDVPYRETPGLGIDEQAGFQILVAKNGDNA